MPLHRLPMKMAFDTGMLLPAFVISSECEKSFSFAARQKKCEDSGERETPYSIRLGASAFHRGKRKKGARIPIPRPTLPPTSLA